MTLFENTLVEVLGDRIAEVFETRRAGHCAQLPHIPLILADEVCESLLPSVPADGRLCVVIDEPTATWHASPAKVVEYRNQAEQQGRRLVVLVPSGSYLPVEDSLGATTFEILDTSDVYAEAKSRSFAHLDEGDEGVAVRARQVLEQVDGSRGLQVGDEAAARFASEIAAAPDAEGFGLAMTRIGLIPDTELLAVDEEDVGPRIGRNLAQMERLASPAAPADRVRDAVVGDGEDTDRLRGSLLRALSEAAPNREAIAHRLGAVISEDGESFTGLLDKEAPRPQIEVLRILRLEGDLDKNVDPPLAKKPQPRIKAVIRCSPAARTIVGLDHLRLSVLHRPELSNELIDIGVVKTKRVSTLGRGTDLSWTVRLDRDELEPGRYVVRVEAVDEDNYVPRSDDSDPFVIAESEEFEDDVERDVATFPIAALEARMEASGLPGGATVTYSRPPERSKAQNMVETFVVRFDSAPGSYRLVLPRALAQIESWTISTPRVPTNYVLSADAQTVQHQEAIEHLPEAFLNARVEVMDQIAAEQLVAGGEGGVPKVVLTCDLRRIKDVVREYVVAWRTAIEDGDRRQREALLSLDRVTIDGIDDCVLVGPTHPLRLAWLTTYSEHLWAAEGDEELSEGDLGRLLRLAKDLAPANVPHVLVAGTGELRYLESLTADWGVWARPSTKDVSSAAADVRRRLLGARSEDGISTPDLVRRIKRYLATHPYVQTLQLNVVQPGSGELVVNMLLALQSDPDFAETHYVVRLFGDDISRSRLGSSLDAFMSNPDGPSRKKEAADAFLASNEDPLAPKLTYSKHDLDALARAPERFPAHMSVFIDWFQLDAVPAPPTESQRSFYADGILIDPVIVFRSGDDALDRESDENAIALDPQWDEYVVAPAGGGWFPAAYATAETATAELLGGDRSGTVPAIRLTLDRVRRTILDAVHRTSDWVVVIDPVFTEDFLDTQRRDDTTPRYLIDAEQRESLRMSRNVVVSTRSRFELSELLKPALAAYELDVAEDRIEAVIDAMHALNPGLALRLFSNAPTHSVEALTLGLAAIELEARGVLRRGLVIPLDLHQDLFREELDFGSEGVAALTRTDLALVRPHPEERTLDVHLVEVKARADLPETLPAPFLEGVAGQLRNSQQVLRSTLFGLDQRTSGSDLMAWIRARRLMRLLTHYAERAHRYGYLPTDELRETRQFLTSLDGPFEVRFALQLIVFDLGGRSAADEERFEDVHVHRIARTRTISLLEAAPTRLKTRPALRQVPATDLLETSVPSAGETVPQIGDTSGEGEPTPANRAAAADQPRADESGPEGIDGTPEPVANDGPMAEDVMLIGEAAASSQFGIIGRLKANNVPVAFDVGGPNVLSVFGVQGAGKSYTLGNVIETALIHSPALHRLPRPLGVVVFHFDNNQNYRPEFASMIDPNDDPDQVAALEELGATPAAVEDVQLLVPAGVVREREEEFEHRIPVHPLVLSPDELLLNDWKLLMGVEGGDQMYVRTMTNLLKGLRGNVSIEGLREAVAESRLSPAQKNNAEIRLDFVNQFVEDGAGVADIVRPGRLVLVDVRDPLMDKGDALALFMVLLRLFSQGQESSEARSNRLVVFDEAHKYMDNPRLTTAIEEAIRQMRHHGTSVVIASQNPPSVPKEVIELSSVLMAHRFTSPQWLDHIKKVSSAFASDISPPQLAKLEPGEAFVYSSGGDPLFSRPQLVRMRPRLTRHGGSTRRATDR